MTQHKQEQIYITWHYTTHGIAYLKHVLSAFYKKMDLTSGELQNFHGLDQNEMNQVFDKETVSGFIFDHIYYLTAPQPVFDKISNRRFAYRKNILTDEDIIASGMQSIWQEVIDLELQKNENHLLEELAYVKQHYPSQYALFLSQVWRDIQHYPIKDQIQWFLSDSNAARLYKNKFSETCLAIKNLRDELEITQQLLKCINDIAKKHQHAHFTINTSLGSTETQVAWFILGDAGCLPNNISFIKTLDDKSTNKRDRFKHFFIINSPTKLISDITQKTIKIYETTQSQIRKTVSLKWDSYIKQGFSILLLGERGTGKSRIVHDKSNHHLVAVDCAAFEDDSKAEAELFGYEKGAFTGADKTKNGLFHEAKNGILFLDEVHNLSKRVQAKLMKALQTDSNNRHYRKIFSSK